MLKTKKTKHWRLSAAALALSLLLGGTLVQAQVDLSSDQEASEASEESTISNIKKVIKDKQLELGQENEKKEKKQAYLAQIKRVSAETLTLKNNKGSKIVSVTAELEFFKDKKSIDIDKIVIDDWVVVYGLIENDNFVAKKIEVSDKDFAQDVRQVSVGSITEIYANNITIQPRNDQSKISAAIDNNTNFLDFTGENVYLNDFYSDLQCIVVAKENKDGKLILSTIKALVTLSN